ncbi:MAG: hypothetical protein ACXAAR_11045 [Candidatus Thorarchaeota archaeon]
MVSSIPRIRALDVGSFPLDADMSRYVEGARLIESDPKAEHKDVSYFIANHNEAFRLKAQAMEPESSVTSFAQCRGMITQYLEPLFLEVLGIREACYKVQCSKSGRRNSDGSGLSRQCP